MFRLKAAVLEAGTPFTPSYWQNRPGGAPSRSPLPDSERESDSENDSTITSPSGRLQSGDAVNSSPAVSSQSRSIFRVSPSSKSPTTSFRLKNMRKASGQLAEDSLSLSNASDSSDHQHHLVDERVQLPVRRQPSRQLSESQISTPPAVPRSAGRTCSPQRVAPAPGNSSLLTLLNRAFILSEHTSVSAAYLCSCCELVDRTVKWSRCRSHVSNGAGRLLGMLCSPNLCEQTLSLACILHQLCLCMLCAFQT